MPQSSTPIDYFVVYESESAISSPDTRLISAVEPGAADHATIELHPGSGVRHFRVGAVSYTGVTGPLSPEYVIDTTSRVVMSMDYFVNDQFELFVNEVGAGHDPHKISGTMVNGGNIIDYAWAPNALYVAFLADRLTDGVNELFVAPADGSSAPIRMNGNLASGGDVAAFSWSPDSTHLLYLAKQNSAAVQELFSAPADGSATAILLSGSLVAGGNIFAASWSPDSESIVFSGDKELDNSIGTYVVPANGSAAALRLSAAPTAGINYYAISGFSPEGARVALFAQDLNQNSTALLTVPSSGGATVNVSGAMVLGGQVTHARWSPDGSRILFVADKLVDETFELFVAPAGGGADPVRVSGVMPATSDVSGSWARWSPTGSSIAFLANKLSIGTVELFVTSPDGGAEPVRINPNLVAGGAVDSYVWAPDGEHLLYLADQNVDNVYEGFVATPDGKNTIRVSGALVAGGNLTGSCCFSWSPDATRVVFDADKLVNDKREIFVAGLTGLLEPLKVSGTIGADRDASMSHGFSPLGIATD